MSFHRHSTVTTTRYERCPTCTDGSCRACGQASNDHAAPGVRLVVRRVRFVPCTCVTGCNLCGANAHELAAPGITVEVIDEHGAKRWVPVIHRNNGSRQSACGARWSGSVLTVDAARVTCKRCLKWMKEG